MKPCLAYRWRTEYNHHGIEASERTELPIQSIVCVHHEQVSMFGIDEKDDDARGLGILLFKRGDDA